MSKRERGPENTGWDEVVRHTESAIRSNVRAKGRLPAPSCEDDVAQEVYLTLLESYDTSQIEEALGPKAVPEKADEVKRSLSRAIKAVIQRTRYPHRVERRATDELGSGAGESANKRRPRGRRYMPQAMHLGDEAVSQVDYRAPDDFVEAVNWAIDLKQALDTLKPEERALLIRSAVDGQSLRALASDGAGTSVKKVRTALDKIKARMKEILK